MLPIEKIKKHGETVRNEFNKKMVGYVVAAFGLVAGLAWNEAVKSLIEYWFPLEQDTFVAKFTYAIFITLILVIVTIILTRSLIRDDVEKPEK